MPRSFRFSRLGERQNDHSPNNLCGFTFTGGMRSFHRWGSGDGGSPEDGLGCEEGAMRDRRGEKAPAKENGCAMAAEARGAGDRRNGPT